MNIRKLLQNGAIMGVTAGCLYLGSRELADYIHSPDVDEGRIILEEQRIVRVYETGVREETYTLMRKTATMMQRILPPNLENIDDVQ